MWATQRRVSQLADSPIINIDPPTAVLPDGLQPIRLTVSGISRCDVIEQLKFLNEGAKVKSRRRKPTVKRVIHMCGGCLDPPFDISVNGDDTLSGSGEMPVCAHCVLELLFRLKQSARFSFTCIARRCQTEVVLGQPKQPSAIQHLCPLHADKLL